MTDPDVLYHKQPHTLDPTKEPPKDDAPLAQGHDDDDRGAVTEAHDEHKDAVKQAEESPEVGPRKPGDHAGSDDSSSDANVTGVDDTDSPPEGTIEEVKAWVGDDHDRAQRALEAERAGQNRATLITWLESV